MTSARPLPGRECSAAFWPPDVGIGGPGDFLGPVGRVLCSATHRDLPIANAATCAAAGRFRRIPRPPTGELPICEIAHPVVWKTLPVRGNETELQAVRATSLVDRLDQRVVVVLTILGFAIPVLAYLWFAHRFSLNAIVGDQWDDVTVIQGSYVHFFDWGRMWVPHNDNRIFFPNIIVVLLAHTVHFNLLVEEWLSVAMLLAATALAILAHKRRSPSTPWLYYCPVAFLMLTWVQWQNTVWGFQFAWYLVLLSFMACVFLLDRPVLTWLAFAGAMVTAVIGTFSSLQGLLIWPVGLALLYFRRRRAWQFGLWVVGGAASAVLYFYHLGASSQTSFVTSHPLESVRFYLVTIGEVLGQTVPLRDSVSSTAPLELFGLLVVLSAVAAVIVNGLRRDESSASPVGVALISYGLLFVASVTQGRAYLGIWAAAQSRYTSFTVILFVGIYLTILGRVPRTAASPQWIDRIVLPATSAAVLMAIVVQVSFAFPDGYRHEVPNYGYFAKAETVLRNIDHASNADVGYYLFYFESDASIRQRAHFLQTHHLSVFAGQ